MKYIKDERKRIILPPYIEEVLEDDFDYEQYINDYFKNLINSEELTDIFNSITPKKVNPHILKIYENYENEIIPVQMEYQKNPQNKQHCNQKMKEIAQKYKPQIDKETKLELQKEKEMQALIIKRQELVDTLHKMLEVKKDIETNSNNRLNDYISGKIPLGKLYIYDLTHPLPYLTIEQRKKLNQKKRIISASLINTEGIYYKQIEKLNIKRSKK